MVHYFLGVDLFYFLVLNYYFLKNTIFINKSKYYALFLNYNYVERRNNNIVIWLVLFHEFLEDNESNSNSEDEELEDSSPMTSRPFNSILWKFGTMKLIIFLGLRLLMIVVWCWFLCYMNVYFYVRLSGICYLGENNSKEGKKKKKKIQIVI